MVGQERGKDRIPLFEEKGPRRSQQLYCELHSGTPEIKPIFKAVSFEVRPPEESTEALMNSLLL